MGEVVPVNDDALTEEETIDIIRVLRDEGFETAHIYLINLMSDTDHFPDNNSAAGLKRLMMKLYTIDMPIGQIRRARRDPRYTAAIAQVFARKQPQLMQSVEMNMYRTAADPNDPQKVQAAKLVMGKEGLLDRTDRRKIAADPAAAFVNQVNKMKREGVIKINQVTGEVIVYESTEIVTETTSGEQTSKAPQEEAIEGEFTVDEEGADRASGDSGERRELSVSEELEEDSFFSD